MAKFMGKLGRLPHEVQLDLAQWLCEGWTYDECREHLEELGYGEDEIPSGNKGFGAFRNSELFKHYVRERIACRARGESRRQLIADIRANGGDDEALASAGALALEALFTSLEESEAEGDTKLRIRAASAMGSLIRDIDTTQSNRLKRQLAQLRLTIEQRAEEGAEDRGISEADLVAEFDKMLGAIPAEVAG